MPRPARAGPATAVAEAREADRKDLQRRSLTELRTRCRKRLLNGSGSKQALVIRLLEQLHPTPLPSPGHYELLVRVIEGRFNSAEVCLCTSRCVRCRYADRYEFGRSTIRMRTSTRTSLFVLGLSASEPP